MSHPAIEAFERRYAERSGVTVEFLHAWGRFGAPCGHRVEGRPTCDEYGCEGFEMMHLRDELLEAGWVPADQHAAEIEAARLAGSFSNHPFNPAAIKRFRL